MLPKRQRRNRLLVVTMASLSLAACGGAAPTGGAPAAPVTGAPTIDAATRTTPVVAGRPSRVFVFAGWTEACIATAAPDVTVTHPPARGEIAFRTGQETTIAASTAGTCAGRKVTGTGVYYTARPGASGMDRFAVEARLASGETAARVFEVTIVE